MVNKSISILTTKETKVPYSGILQRTEVHKS